MTLKSLSLLFLSLVLCLGVQASGAPRLSLKSRVHSLLLKSLAKKSDFARKMIRFHVEQAKIFMAIQNQEMVQSNLELAETYANTNPFDPDFFVVKRLLRSAMLYAQSGQYWYAIGTCETILTYV